MLEMWSGAGSGRKGGGVGSELVQFALALVLFAVILIGSYWFVYAPSRGNFRRGNDRRRLR